MRTGAETRFVDVAGSEVRMDTTEDGRRVVRGVAIRYGSLSNPLKDSKGRTFRERFQRGAFSRALATGADVRLLVNHNRDLILGRNKSGTLRLFDDDDALRFEADTPATAIGEHYRTSVERGDLSGVSFRFYKIADKWSGAGEATVRDVYEADVDDVSLVTYPAYPDTEAAARSLDEHAAAAAPPQPWPCADMVRLRLAESDV